MSYVQIEMRGFAGIAWMHAGMRGHSRIVIGLSSPAFVRKGIGLRHELGDCQGRKILVVAVRHTCVWSQPLQVFGRGQVSIRIFGRRGFAPERRATLASGKVAKPMLAVVCPPASAGASSDGVPSSQSKIQ
ncbi:MAG: hypothetical protein OEZ57_10355, partial [Nitrospirota bacterium]|nr:hypothetical protein [Nitrospirota bacterium]